MHLNVKSIFLLVTVISLYVNGQPISDKDSDKDKKENQLNIDLNTELQSYMSDMLASARQSTPAAGTGSNGVSSIISGLLGQVGTAITPSLGAFGPLATAVGPSVNNGLTSLLSNAFSGLFRIVSRGDLPISGYETYLVNIPNQGSYILLAKSPESSALQEPTIPSPTETVSASKPSSPQSQFIAELNRLGLNALVNSNPVLMQQLQKSNNPTVVSTTPAPIVYSPKDTNKNVMIPMSFLNTLTGSALNSLISQQQGKHMFESYGGNEINIV